MSLSNAARANIILSDNPVAWLTLLTFSIPGSGLADIRISSDSVDTVSRGQTFLACPFEIVLPNDNGETNPSVTLRVANLPSILEAIRGYRVAPRMKLEVVMSSTPDVVERSIDWLRLDNVNYDAMFITGTLTVEDILHSGFPCESYDAISFPGLVV